MWVWLKLKLTSKGEHTKNRLHGIFCKFFMHSPKLPEWAKCSDFPSQTPQVRPKFAIYTAKARLRASPDTFIWESPRSFTLFHCTQRMVLAISPSLSLGHSAHLRVYIILFSGHKHLDDRRSYDL